MSEKQEYHVLSGPRLPHGNTKRGLPFHRLQVGEWFEIPVEDYGRTNSARAHFQKKHPGMLFSSRSFRKDGKIVGYHFRRES